jgi:hypothetical protein
MNMQDKNSHTQSKRMKHFATLAVLCVAVVTSGVVVQAQEGSSKVQAAKTQELDERAAQRELAKLASNSSWSRLVDKAKQLGFTATNDGGIIKATVEKERAAELKVFPYLKEGSGDAAALINVTDGKQNYYALLIAKDGDFQNAAEFTVKSNEVVPAHSWWKCTQEKLKECGSPCGAALVSCIGKDWRVYLFCVAGQCGECFVQKAVECIGK